MKIDNFHGNNLMLDYKLRTGITQKMNASV